MKKILIAKDNGKIGAVLGRWLGAAGYQVQVLQNGFCSYLRVVTNQPDLILMDIYMPRAKGLAVARELRRRMGRHAKEPKSRMRLASVKRRSMQKTD